MDEIYIIGISVSVVITLIGVIYGITISSVKKNTSEIERVDKATDKRLDDAEKEIVIIKTKIEK